VQAERRARLVRAATRLDQAQDLLETADPVARLEKLMTLMSEGRKAA
jgi:hypothetical protein